MIIPTPLLNQPYQGSFSCVDPRGVRGYEGDALGQQLENEPEYGSLSPRFRARCNWSAVIKTTYVFWLGFSRKSWRGRFLGVSWVCLGVLSMVCLRRRFVWEGVVRPPHMTDLGCAHYLCRRKRNIVEVPVCQKVAAITQEGQG